MKEEKGYWNGFWERRVSRRRVLKAAGLGGAGLAAAALVGCGDEEEKPAATAAPAPSPAAPAASPARPTASPTPAAKQPKRGGTVVRETSASGVFPEGLDPHRTGGSESGHMNLFYQGLVRVHPVTFGVEPEIGQKWEQPSPTEYIFTLAPGIKWQNKAPLNGRELVADDVVFSLERARTNDPTFQARSLLAGVDKIAAVDKNKVRITTKAPDVTALVNLSDVSLLVLAREVAEKVDLKKSRNPDESIGTGAFMLQSLDDVSAALVRNPDYWKPGLPYLDGVKEVFIRDPKAALGAFLAGQLDITQIPGTESKKFVEQRSKEFSLGWSPGVNIFLIQPNIEKAPFKDPRVTRALRLLVDHQEAITGYVDVWWGGGTSFTLAHSMEAWDFSKDEYAKTLEWKQPKDEATKEAIVLLSAAGFTKDNPLKFTQMNNNTTDTGQPSTQLLQAQWQRLSQGVAQAELQLVDNATSRTRQARGEFENSGPVGRGSYFDPQQLLLAAYASKGSINFTKHNDTKLDEMISETGKTFNVERRKALVKEIVKHIIENLPQTNFFSRDILNATLPKVKEFLPESGRPSGYQFERIWLDV